MFTIYFDSLVDIQHYLRDSSSYKGRQLLESSLIDKGHLSIDAVLTVNDDFHVEYLVVFKVCLKCGSKLLSVVLST